MGVIIHLIQKVENMIRAHIIKLYPTKEQEIQLNKTAGACRFAWNQALSYWDKQYKKHCDNPSVKKPTTFAVAKWYMDNREEWSKEIAFVCVRGSQSSDLEQPL